MKENVFQHKLINVIKHRLPNCIILKNDANYLPGVPDLTILCFRKWAFLEVKQSKTAPHRPNQDYYIRLSRAMSFGEFVYPENVKEILDSLCEYMKS